MRGVGGKPGWFYLFLLEGLLTFLLGFIVSSPPFVLRNAYRKQSFLYLPASPTNTRSVLCRRSWYTEREEVIMTNVRKTSNITPQD